MLQHGLRLFVEVANIAAGRLNLFPPKVQLAELGDKIVANGSRS